MRVLFLVAASSLIVTSAAVSFLACGGDDAADTTGDGGTGSLGGDGSSGGQGTSGSDGTGAPDAGEDVKRAPNGCILFTTNTKSGNKLENVPRTDISGAVDWTNPMGAQKQDDQVAQVILGDGQESATLKASDFGLTLPAGADTWGIVVELQRRTLTDGGVLQTSNVNVVIAGKTPMFKYDNADFYWPRPIVGTHDYGQEVDTWGVDLVPADVTTPEFAATLAVKKAPGSSPPGPITGIVDALKVAVWYATGDATHCAK